MNLRPEEISSVIKEQIERYASCLLYTSDAADDMPPGWKYRMSVPLSG